MATEYPKLRDRYFGDFVVVLLGSELELVRQAYLQDLWSQLQPMPLTAMGLDGQRPVPLLKVYTALDVEQSFVPGPFIEVPSLGTGLKADQKYLEALAKWKAREVQQRSRPGDRRYITAHHHPLSALEAVAASPRLVLTGEGGGGKSTFVRYLALCHAGEWLEREEAHLESLEQEGAPEGRPRTWPHGPQLPIYVELRRFTGSEETFPAEGDRGEAQHLLAYLQEASGKRGLPPLGDLLRALLGARGEGVLLVLDGLDETSEAEEVRERLRQVIFSWADLYPRSRILVTSRPYAYTRKSPWRLDGAGFGEAALAELGDAKIESFIQGWYPFLAAQGQVDPERTGELAADLWREIKGSYLHPVARRPMMLTMVTNLHARSGHLPHGGRAGVYRECVELLLDQWNEGRGIVGKGKGMASGRLGMTIEQLNRALESLAFDVHREEGGAENAAEITARKLWEQLEAHRPSTAEEVVDERRVREYLAQRSGILIEERDGLYRFPHRSFQEYLAARDLYGDDEFPERLCQELRARPELWREVVVFLGGQVVESRSMLWSLLRELLPGAEPGSLESLPDPDDPAWLRILYAGLALQATGLWREEAFRRKRQLRPLRAWLAATLEAGAHEPADRALAGKILGRIGDERPGVGLDDDDLPDIAWLKVPFGAFRMGSAEDDSDAAEDEKPQRSVQLPAFELARHPVTNTQYETFVRAGGYGKPGEAFWSEEGRAWRKEEKIEGPQDLDPRYLYPNYPRVGVCFWEAEAFCRWLSRARGRAVRLPTEEEWEKAARGEDGRIYPWEGAWEPGICNAEDILGNTAAVGAFPRDRSPYGALDMAGNVWEWTGSLYEGGPFRVIRGGSCAGHRQVCRTACRLWPPPAVRNRLLGFRLVRT